MALIPSNRNVHRLLTGGLAIAIRQHNVLDEDHCKKVCGVPTTDELNKIMNTFLQFIERDTGVSVEEMMRTFNNLNAMKNTTDFPGEDSMSEANSTEVHGTQ